MLKKDLPNVPLSEQLTVLARIKTLHGNPFPGGYVKLVNYTPATYRLRQGNYRILYRVIDDMAEVRIIQIGHRGSVYQK